MYKKVLRMFGKSSAKIWHIGLLFGVFFNYHLVHPIVVQQMSVFDFIKKFPETHLIHGLGKYFFDFGQHPLGEYDKNKKLVTSDIFLDSFIITIPQAKIFIATIDFYPIVNDCFITEMKLKFENQFGDLSKVKEPQFPVKFSGRVAVITNMYEFCYFHWVNDLISKLALLELHGIEYDYIFIPQYKSYMKETLELWGIDTKKIISAYVGMGIQADEIIMTTSVSTTSSKAVLCNYMQPMILHCIRNKMIPNALLKSQKRFSPKVFISRKDSGNKRVALNEDDVFHLFETKGFVRYCLADMALADQIALFHQATDIVSFHGAGLTNVIFCKPQTRIIEIFQKHFDASYWGFSKMLNLRYDLIDATGGKLLSNIFQPSEELSLDLVADFLKKAYF